MELFLVEASLLFVTVYVASFVPRFLNVTVTVGPAIAEVMEKIVNARIVIVQVDARMVRSLY